MAVHLTRIYTRTGDDGTTGFRDFSRVSKNDPRLVAYADCDEANAAIGAAMALGNPTSSCADVLRQIQNDLFDAGADLSTPVVENPKYPPLRITQPYIDRLEAWCDEFNEDLPALKSFICPAVTASPPCCMSPERWRDALNVRRGTRSSGTRHRQPATRAYLNRLPTCCSSCPGWSTRTATYSGGPAAPRPQEK